MLRVSKTILQEENKRWESYQIGSRVSKRTKLLIGNSLSIMGSIIGNADDNVRAVYHGGELQGAVVYGVSNDEMRVAFIAVAPWNVYGMPDRLSGCGAYMMRHIFKIVSRDVKIKGVSLVAFDEAVNFYRKLGFTERGASMFISRRKINGKLGK
jgi:hypothetical protein